MNKKVLIPILLILVLSTSVFAFSLLGWYRNTNNWLTGKVTTSMGQCVAEGQTTPVVQNLLPCCGDLDKISVATASYDAQGGLLCRSSSGVSLCSNCGNGVCESWENICNCPADCKTEAKCTDSDGGRNYYVRGTVTEANGDRTVDSCDPPSGRLIEHYCSGDVKSTEYPYCPGEFICKDGACIQTTPKILSFWTDKEVYYDNEIVKFTLKVVDGDGTPFTPEEGAKVYLNPTAPSGGLDNWNIAQEMSYNYGSGYYEYQPYVTSNAERGVWTAYATVKYADDFLTSEKIYFTLANSTQVCTDSDGGENYYVFGTVTISRGGNLFEAYKDSCDAETGRLIENWCIKDSQGNPQRGWGYHVCENGCKDGACIKEMCVAEGETTPIVPNALSCCDALKKISIATTSYDAQGGLLCRSSSGVSLCSNCGNGICESGWENICNCPEDCPTEQKCTDSDGGKNYYVKGETCAGGKCSTDACIVSRCQGTTTTRCIGDTSQVQEYFCEGGEAKSEFKDCLVGCKDGACIREACIAEGQTTPIVPVALGCCEGLSSIAPAAVTYDSNGNQLCNFIQGTSLCSNCGNGKCESWENICNCPADCKTEAKCTDSDGGKNFFVKGTTTGRASTKNNVTITRKDICSAADKNSLIEYFCSEDNLVQAYMTPCENGCKDGACIPAECPVIMPPAPDWCKDGIIVQGEIDANGCQLPPTCLFCKDSDGGKNFYVRGTTTGRASTKNNVTITRKDICSAADKNSLIEYFCSEDNTVQAYMTPCENGCKDGACVTPICVNKCGDGVCAQEVCQGTGCPCPETEQNCPSDCASKCTDSDGGKNFFVKGTTTGRASTMNNATITRRDMCSLAQKNGLVEYFCGEDNVVQAYLTTCKNGCKDGACIKESVCYTDEDCPPKEERYCKDSSACINITNYKCVSGDLPYCEAIVDAMQDVCKICPNGCKDGACITHESCYNTLQDGDESDVDCGGSCPPCPVGEACLTNKDCKTNYCLNGYCMENPNTPCKDSDGGRNYYVKGESSGVNDDLDFIESSDSCLPDSEGSSRVYSGPYLGELYCKSDTLIDATIYECPEGCRDSACIKGTEPEPACDGCYYTKKCLSVGARVGTLYCSMNGLMERQVKDDEGCTNNYECRSNICINNSCIKGSVWLRFLRWIGAIG